MSVSPPLSGAGTSPASGYNVSRPELPVGISQGCTKPLVFVMPISASLSMSLAPPVNSRESNSDQRLLHRNERDPDRHQNCRDKPDDYWANHRFMPLVYIINQQPRRMNLRLFGHSYADCKQPQSLGPTPVFDSDAYNTPRTSYTFFEETNSYPMSSLKEPEKR